MQRTLITDKQECYAGELVPFWLIYHQTNFKGELIMIGKIEINKLIMELTDISKIYFEYDAAKKEAVETYRDRTMEERLEQCKADARAKANRHSIAADGVLDSMIEEVKKGNEYNSTDPAISNAILALSKPGISDNTVLEVILAFKGNVTALELIKGGADESYKGLFDPYLFDNVKALEDIKNMFSQFGYEDIENYPNIVSSIREKLTEFITKQQIDAEIYSETLEKMRMRTIGMMMGLDPKSYE